MKLTTFYLTRVVIILSLAMLGLTSAALAVTDILGVLSVNPDRAHRVPVGAKTTFVLKLYNAGPGHVSSEVVLSSVTQGWAAELAVANANFQPTGSGSPMLNFPDITENESRYIVVTVTPDIYLEAGQSCSVQVNAAMSNGTNGSVSVQAIVNNQPKMYFISIDGCSPLYMRLGRHGNKNPNSDDLLMPNIFRFWQESAGFPNARDSLPAVTDPNMFCLLSGSWPGTAGLASVGLYFKGWDSQGQEVNGRITSDALRYGADGQPVLSVFDVAKDPVYGGDPDTFTALISGKWFLVNLFSTGPDTDPYGFNSETDPDILANGYLRPYYLTQPQPYVLGDPITDDNAQSDRDGVNIFPLSEYRKILYGMSDAGDSPGAYPSDRWVAESSLRIIAVEDPDVFAVHFGSVDKIQHAAGSADLPQEWIDPGTPDVLWDDINIFNRNANREPVLDVVYEADACTGLILNEFEARGVADKSIIVLASDHSARTYMNIHVDPKAIIDAAGLGDAVERSTAEVVRRITGWQETGTINLWDSNDAPAVAAALENYTVFHPVLQQDVKPLIAITRTEMASGVDSVIGRFGRDGGPLRGEMYSEWLIDHPVDNNTKAVWPDIFIFTRYRFQLVKEKDSLPKVCGGHSGKETMKALLAIRGPDFSRGIFDVQETSLADVVPTIYQSLGWTSPGNVDGRILSEILSQPQ